MKYFFSICLLLAFFACKNNEQASTDKQLRLAIGTYTGGGSYGIYLADFDLQNGSLVISDSLMASNPSYLAFDNKRNILYAVNENGGDVSGTIESWVWNSETRKFENKGRVASGGDHPCYITTIPGTKYLAAANYSGGSVGIIPLGSNGVTTDSVFIHVRLGSGPQTDRQEKSHVHTCRVDEKSGRLWLADLGTDEVVGYKINEAGVDFGDSILIQTPPGSGPRHIEVHQTLPIVYVVNELTGSVGVWQIGSEGATSFQQIRTDTISSRPGSADIHMSNDSKFLYVSNRGEANNITVLKVLENGQLDIVQHISTKGITPRNFMVTPDDNWLLVANQNSNNIVLYKRDLTTGILSATDQVFQVPNPSCLLPIGTK